MASEKVYPKGIIGFNKKQGQPAWLIGSLIIDPNALFEWLKGEGKQYLTEYTGKDGKATKQLKLTLGEGTKGMSISVDTWKPEKKQDSNWKAEQDDSGLPF